MKAYRINEYEWVAAPDSMTRDELEAWYLAETGVDKEDGFDEMFEEAPLDTKMFTDDTEDGSQAETTFGAVIADYVERNGEEPFLLASTEY